MQAHCAPRAPTAQHDHKPLRLLQTQFSGADALRTYQTCLPLGNANNTIHIQAGFNYLVLPTSEHANHILMHKKVTRVIDLGT